MQEKRSTYLLLGKFKGVKNGQLTHLQQQEVSYVIKTSKCKFRSTFRIRMLIS